MNVRRRLVSIAVVALAAASWTTTTAPAAHALEDGCEAASGSWCMYRATRSGGILATGNSWRVAVVRRGRATWYGPANWLDARNSTFKRTNVIRAGDRVYVRTGNMWAEWPPVVAGAVAVGSAVNR